MLGKDTCSRHRYLLDGCLNMGSGKLLLELNAETRTSIYQCWIKEHTDPGSGIVSLSLPHLAWEPTVWNIYWMVQRSLFWLRQNPTHCRGCTGIPEKIRSDFALWATYSATKVGSQIRMGRLTSASVTEWQVKVAACDLRAKVNISSKWKTGPEWEAGSLDLLWLVVLANRSWSCSCWDR